MRRRDARTSPTRASRKSCCATRSAPTRSTPAIAFPEEYRHNTPERLEEAFAAQRRAGLFSEYPFGTDLTREEIDLARALRWLKENTGGNAARACDDRARVVHAAATTRTAAYLARLQLDAPAEFLRRA